MVFDKTFENISPDTKSCRGRGFSSSYCDDLCVDIKRHYYGSIYKLDEQIGRVRSLLSQYDVADNTILVLSSDNGPARYDSGRIPLYIGPGSALNFKQRKFSTLEGGT